MLASASLCACESVKQRKGDLCSPQLWEVIIRSGLLELCLGENSAAAEDSGTRPHCPAPNDIIDMQIPPRAHGLPALIRSLARQERDSRTVCPLCRKTEWLL